MARSRMRSAMRGTTTLIIAISPRAFLSDRIHQMRRFHRQQASLLDLDARFGDVGANRAPFGERFAEGDAPGHPPTHRLERALGDANQPHAVVDAGGCRLVTKLNLGRSASGAARYA